MAGNRAKKEDAAAARERERQREYEERTIKSAGNSIAVNAGRKVGSELTKGLGYLGRQIGGNVGAGIGRAIMSALFKL